MTTPDGDTATSGETDAAPGITARHAAAGLFLVDAQGRTLYANPAAEAMLGWTQAEMEGKALADVLFRRPGEPDPAGDNILADALRSGRTLPNHEDTLYRRDGTRLPALCSATPIFAAGEVTGATLVVHEITARRRLEDALRASEARLRLALDAARMGIWEWNVRTNELHWSEQLEAIHGMAPGTFDGTFECYRNVIHPDDRQPMMDTIQQALESGTEFATEFRVVYPDGSLHWVAGEGSVFRDEAGAPVKMIGVGLDVTPRMQTQQELSDAYDALSAAYERERRIAETLQRSLLLNITETKFPNLEVAALYEFAHEDALVGGDFYDAFRLENGKAAFLVGDVTGKGLAAAAHTAEAKFALRAFLSEYPHPASALMRLNRFLLDSDEGRDASGRRRTLVALSLAVVDTLTGEVEAAAAGAEPPLALRARTGASEEIPAGGLPLGTDPDARYESVHTVLFPGDLLVLATDGITEARQGPRSFFGYEGLARSARQATASPAATAAASPSPQAIGRAIITAARAFAGGKIDDDLCLLLVRRCA